MASESKSKIIAHFWDCKCRDHDVTSMGRKLNIKQANMSKHISKLSSIKVLDCIKDGKERFYYINKEWKEEWKDIIVPQLKIESNKKFMCSCSKG